jgi:hypothetical protein
MVTSIWGSSSRGVTITANKTHQQSHDGQQGRECVVLKLGGQLAGKAKLAGSGC